MRILSVDIVRASDDSFNNALSRAVVMVLEGVHEQDFRDCSFGFRPGRSAHDALQTLWEQTMVMGGGWVIDLDIQGFFDVLDHRQLCGFLDQRGTRWRAAPDD